MSNPINDGGPAFPHKPTRSEPAGPDGWVLVTPGDEPGMTLRDYFAAQALNGLLAHVLGVKGAGPDGYARRSYEYADAMLKARREA